MDRLAKLATKQNPTQGRIQARVYGWGGGGGGAVATKASWEHR